MQTSPSAFLALWIQDDATNRGFHCAYQWSTSSILATCPPTSDSWTRLSSRQIGRWIRYFKEWSIHWEKRYACWGISQNHGWLSSLEGIWVIWKSSVRHKVLETTWWRPKGFSTTFLFSVQNHIDQISGDPHLDLELSGQFSFFQIYKHLDLEFWNVRKEEAL